MRLRRDAPFVLRVAGHDPLAQTAVEIAPALKELHRLAEQEAGEGIAGRKRREDEEAVGGDAEQHIDLLAVEFRRRI